MPILYNIMKERTINVESHGSCSALLYSVKSYHLLSTTG